LIVFFKKQGIDNRIFFGGLNGKKPPPKNSCFKKTLHLDSWVCVDLCLYLATSGASQCFFFPGETSLFFKKGIGILFGFFPPPSANLNIF
jgi:hypothetical protein